MAKTPSPKTRLQGIADTVGKKRDGKIQAKRTYFYRHGMTAQAFQAAVKAAIPEAENMECGDKWAQWPATSYFWCTFTMPEPKAESQPEPAQVA